MEQEKKKIIIVLINYLLLVAFLSLGGFLYNKYPKNEAIGGIIIGLSGIIIGIILPYHLRKIKVVEYNFLPDRKILGKVILATLIFIAIMLLIYPSGILGDKSTMTIFKNPPHFKASLFTFFFLLFSATTYALLFWGGLLHVLQINYSKTLAIIATSFLFSIYHIAEFAFIDITFGFLLKMFIGGLMCTSFTLLAKSVIPTLIAQQCAQYVYFASLKENPFSDPMGFVSNCVLLLILLGIYKILTKKIKWIN